MNNYSWLEQKLHKFALSSQFMREVTFDFESSYLSTSGDENLYISDVMNGSHFSGNGRYTAKCHNLISNILDCPNVLLTDSCTSALEICASIMRDYSSEQEVIIPSYTFSSTAAAFAKLGFKIIFCDIDKNSMMMDVEDAISKITEKTATSIRNRIRICVGWYKLSPQGLPFCLAVKQGVEKQFHKNKAVLFAW